MIRARSARLRRVVAVRTHAVSCARSCAATANLVATAMPCLHHAITGMASELTRRDTRECSRGRGGTMPPRARPAICGWRCGLRESRALAELAAKLTGAFRARPAGRGGEVRGDDLSPPLPQRRG